MSPRLRTLEQGDLEAMVELDTSCFPPEVAFDREVFRDCLLADSCQSFGLFDADRLLAFAVVHHASKRAVQLFTLDVDPDRRRQGLADALMAELERRARDRGARKLSLQVGVDNLAALGLYHKWGYSILGRVADYYGAGRDAYFMDKLLMETKAGRGPDQSSPESPISARKSKA